MSKTILAILAASLLPAAASAAPKTVTLEVPGMTCPTCPITIRKALLKQPGVSSVAVAYDKKELTVAFDDAKTTTGAILKATASVGFPSQVAKVAQVSKAAK